MIRFVLISALLLLCTCQKKNSDVPDAPQAPVLPHGFKAPTLKCTLLAPSGWTPSASVMPDHLAELIATAPNLRGRMVVRESIETTMPAAIEQMKQRTAASWGSQPDFTLLREDPLGEGRVFAYQWRRQASGPIERHLVALLPFESKVVMAVIDDDGATPEAHLLASVGTLKCSPKQPAATPD